MMEIHANLLGEWYCLNDDPNCTIGDSGKSPELWYEENAEIWNEKDFKENTFYDFPYVKINYYDRTYRIHPVFIQIASVAKSNVAKAVAIGRPF